MSSSVNKIRVAFQGERGAFSEQAAISLLGAEIEVVPRRTFAELFRSVDEDVAELIVAPVANSISGVVRPSVELLDKCVLNRLGEVSIPIAQNLIGCHGSSFSELTSVQSHPVALAQCQRFLKEHQQLKVIVADDTAGSVREIVKANDHQRAAIAGQLAAELYGGVILREAIQDHPENYTRFVLLGPTHALAKTTQTQLEKE